MKQLRRPTHWLLPTRLCLTILHAQSSSFQVPANWHTSPALRRHWLVATKAAAVFLRLAALAPESAERVARDTSRARRNGLSSQSLCQCAHSFFFDLCV
jgi:hypothetical protein